MANQKSKVLSYLNSKIEEGEDITQMSKEEMLTGVRENIDVNISDRAVFKVERELRKGTLTPSMIQQQMEPQNQSDGTEQLDEVAENSPNKPAEVQEAKIGEMNFHEPYLFKTNTPFDRIMSDDLGIYSGCVYVFPGESGAGKSTLLLDMLSRMIKLEENSELRPIYVSSEMTTNDLQFYYRRNPNISNIPTLLLEQYLRAGNVESCISQVFDGRYNFIILDSFEDTIGKLTLLGMRRSKAEFKLLSLMLDAAENHNVTTIPIQHMTKGGKFKGDSTLIYLTQGMINVRIDKSGERYLLCEKNRRGGVTQRPLYFTKKENGHIEFEEERFDRMLEGDNFEEEEKQHQQNSAKSFEQIFGLSEEESEVEDAEYEETASEMVNQDSPSENDDEEESPSFSLSAEEA